MTPLVHPALPALSRPLTTLAAALLVASLCSPLHAQQLIAPTATVASFSQSILSAQLAQWALSYPTANNPLLDTTGAHSALGDQGQNFFLASSTSSTPVVRSVTVRTDQVLVFSPISIIYWTLPGDAINTEAGMLADAAFAFGDVSNLSVTFDGAPALLPSGVSSLDQFRQSSPLFQLSFPVDHIYTGFGYPPGTFPAVTLGITYALEALPVGQHQLRFTSTNQSTGPYAAFPSFSYDVTYNITAVPEPATVAMLCLGLAVVGGVAMRRRRADH